MPVRRGPKFEITFEQAVENVRIVARRLNVAALSVRQYHQHGSYDSRSLTKKWRWSLLCTMAGLICLYRPGRTRRLRRVCMECAQRQSQTTGPHCRTCKRRIRALARGIERL